MIILGTSYYHTKLLQYFDYIPYAIHYIPVTYLFYNWKCVLFIYLFIIFVRASLIFIDQMVVNHNKILCGGSMFNAQSLIYPKPNFHQSPIF